MYIVFNNNIFTRVLHVYKRTDWKQPPSFFVVVVASIVWLRCNRKRFELCDCFHVLGKKRVNTPHVQKKTDDNVVDSDVG